MSLKCWSERSATERVARSGGVSDFEESEVAQGIWTRNDRNSTFDNRVPGIAPPDSSNSRRRCGRRVPLLRQSDKLLASKEQEATCEERS